AEPSSAADNIEFAVSVDVNDSQPLMLVYSFPVGRFAQLFRLTIDAVVVDLCDGPRIGVKGIARHLRNEQAMRVLIPKDNLRRAAAVKVSFDLIVMLGGS